MRAKISDQNDGEVFLMDGLLNKLVDKEMSDKESSMDREVCWRRHKRCTEN